MPPTSNSRGSERLVAALSRVSEISTIRDVAFRIMRVTNDRTADAVALAGVVGSDPALSARVIRTVNSVAYGLRKKVDRLVEAVTLLGFKRVRNLSMAALICDLFESSHSFGTYDRRGLWQHMVAVGIGARALMGAVGYPDPEEAFLAGLLHDIGIILEDQYCHDDFVRAVMAATPQEPFSETEARIIGFDHTQLGLGVAVAWRFPDAAADTIAFHHRADDYEGPAVEIVLAASVANWVCTDAGISAKGLCDVAPPSERTLKRLGLRAEFLPVLADDIRSELVTDNLLVVV